MNDVARPVFVNHYYAGEAFIPVTSKKLIKLNECDMSTENSLRNIQQQGTERKYREHPQNSWMAQQQTRIEKGQMQQNENKTKIAGIFTAIYEKIREIR